MITLYTNEKEIVLLINILNDRIQIENNRTNILNLSKLNYKVLKAYEGFRYREEEKEKERRRNPEIPFEYK